MSWNQDIIGLIEELNEYIHSTSIEEFAAHMGKNPEHARRDCWIIEKYTKLKSQPLELFLNFDRAHQALFIRAIKGNITNTFDKMSWEYEYYEKDLGAYIGINYTVETEKYGEDADGNRGELRMHATINEYIIFVEKIDITDFIDISEYDPNENDDLHETLINRYMNNNFKEI